MSGLKKNNWRVSIGGESTGPTLPRAYAAVSALRPGDGGGLPARDGGAEHVCPQPRARTSRIIPAARKLV